MLSKKVYAGICSQVQYLECRDRVWEKCCERVSPLLCVMETCCSTAIVWSGQLIIGCEAVECVRMRPDVVFDRGHSRHVYDVPGPCKRT